MNLTKIGTLVAVPALALSLALAPDAEARRGSTGRACEDTSLTQCTQVADELGRTNVHSGGRLRSSANKRVGCGGCKGHPASSRIEDGHITLIVPSVGSMQLFRHRARDGVVTRRGHDSAPGLRGAVRRTRT